MGSIAAQRMVRFPQSNGGKVGTKERPSILFLNVGWMKRYNGPAPDDPTRGSFGWLSSKGVASTAMSATTFPTRVAFASATTPAASEPTYNDSELIPATKMLRTSWSSGSAEALVPRGL